MWLELSAFCSVYLDLVSWDAFAVWHMLTGSDEFWSIEEILLCRPSIEGVYRIRNSVSVPMTYVRFYSYNRWISSVMTFLVFFGSIFSGRYFDSHGTRNLLISGSLLFVGALVGIACECLNRSRHGCTNSSLQNVLAAHAGSRGGRYLWIYPLLSFYGCGWTLVHEEKKYRSGDCRLWKWIIRCHLPYHDQKFGRAAE